DINSKNAEGQVALDYAAREGHDAIVKLLLARKGIEVNPVDSYGCTPLDYAAMGKNQDVTELLQG
ncbi:ankyrin repeat-containing domain protein, partial [Infundibulicybe gibba]